MSKHAAFSVHVSTGVHIAAAVLGLAWHSFAPEPPHYHVRSGTISIQASFASPEPVAQPTYEISLTPTESKTVEQSLAAVLKPQAMELRPQRVSVETSLTRAELPPDLEACDCEADEHKLETPKRQSAEEPQIVDHIPEPEPVRRTETVPDVNVAAEIELPSIESLGSDVDELARPLSTNRLPTYPRGALSNGQQVQGIVHLVINADGSVESVELVKSCGVASADDSALKAIATWRFEPARRGGQSVASALNVPFRFRNLW
jgi:periplasmic protein TonB